METVPVIILEREGRLSGTAESRLVWIGQKILVVDDESRMRKLVKGLPSRKQLRCGGGRRWKRGAGYFFEQNDIALIILTL